MNSLLMKKTTKNNLELHNQVPILSFYKILLFYIRCNRKVFSYAYLNG